MRKIQITIAIYIIVVLIMSIFFMPMNRMLIGYGEDQLAETIRYKPFWDTVPHYDNEEDESKGIGFYYIYNMKVYKFHISILTLVTLSIIAIQALQIIKTQPLQPNVKE